MVVHGVPKDLAKNGWWLGENPSSRRKVLGLLLVALAALGDAVVWQVAGGLGIVLWAICIAAATQLLIGPKVTCRAAFFGWTVLIVALLPAIELIQALSIGFVIAGLLGFSAVLIVGTSDVPAVLRAMRRLPGWGFVQFGRDLRNWQGSVPTGGYVKGTAMDWALPLGIGSLFILLMAAGNPVLGNWLDEITTFEHLSFDFGRGVLWFSIVLYIWPFLRLTELQTSLAAKPRAFRTRRTGLINDRSVIRALVVFNLIFATQTSLDLGYLWGGVALPDGMTYASYAHRGAYPLLLTAVLAGIFALLSQPFLTAGWVRGLMYLWVAQTILLVVSSILRLDLYVDVYGLTRLRFAAFVWMGVVALGLVLIIMQMVGRQNLGWFMLRAAGLGAIALYTCSLINVDGMIARYNLNNGKRDHYVCTLSEGALPAIVRFEQVNGSSLCGRRRPYLSTPDDWREWGFRNARLRHSLAAMERTQ